MTPYRIVIGPHIYNVVADDRLLEERDLAGQIRYNEGNIVLRSDLRGNKRRDVLLHEICHGCIHLSGAQDQRVEGILERLTPMLLHTLRTNPDLDRKST